MDSDIDIETPSAKKQKKGEQQEKTTVSITSTKLLDAHHHSASQYAPPLASYSSPTLQKQHIVTQILQQHGKLTHEQVMKHAKLHAPYASALASIPKSKNWRMELVCALGDKKFMPNLIREGQWVALPLSAGD